MPNLYSSLYKTVQSLIFYLSLNAYIFNDYNLDNVVLKLQN